ncbi:hypothetical protein [Hyphomicrobium sp. LHD-15]|uniref:hypothetical protein n=1 Tax=Hyphomicrobium sp. LHD-15 TaxID=3072142 RepID=UPI00280F4B50|nr:hypothetical protein [Hyphomicrobium sp. LHD-15]MDQ8697472.1 hypothetical protein [Hyphomicrobium sp. LHD-15]
MRKTILAAALLIASVSATHAYTPANIDTNSLSGKAMADHPGVTGRSKITGFPGRPDETSLSGQEMRRHPGNHGGTTANPTAKPQDESLSGKAMHDHPGNS